MDYYAIGQRIRKVRKARGLSQEELAERVGISTTHMSHIETGNTKMSLPIFAELAVALETRSDELLYGENQMERDALVTHIAEMMSDCSTQQMRIIEDIIKATKQTLNKNI